MKSPSILISHIRLSRTWRVFGLGALKSSLAANAQNFWIPTSASLARAKLANPSLISRFLIGSITGVWPTNMLLAQPLTGADPLNTGTMRLIARK